jgi:uncharacterized protein YjbI with pentapeptide repeats
LKLDCLRTEQAEVPVSRLSTILVVFLGTIATAHAFDPSALDGLRENNHCAKCDLSGADLGAAGLTGAGLAGADLSGANLQKALLIGADLSDANLREADLGGALLEDANLAGADLTGARLEATRLSGADLDGVSGLTQTQLDQTCNNSTGFPDKTRLPKGLTLRRCR